MHVHVDQDGVVDVAGAGEELGVEDGRVEELGGVLPATVEVHAQDVAAVVALDDTVGVQHGDQLEDEAFAEGLSFFV